MIPCKFSAFSFFSRFLLKILNFIDFFQTKEDSFLLFFGAFPLYTYLCVCVCVHMGSIKKIKMREDFYQSDLWG